MQELRTKVDAALNETGTPVSMVWPKEIKSKPLIVYAPTIPGIQSAPGSEAGYMSMYYQYTIHSLAPSTFEAEPIAEAVMVKMNELGFRLSMSDMPEPGHIVQIFDLTMDVKTKITYEGGQ